MITIGDLYRRNARHNPNGIAVVHGDERVTHAQMLARVEKASRRLTAMKLAHQERFAILSKNSLQYVELYGAAETTGFVAVAINYRLAAEEMAYIVNDSAPKVLFFEEEFTPVVDHFRGKLARDVRFVCIGSPPVWAESYDDLPLAAADAVPQSDLGDLVYLIYTSGTSGRPKGAMLDQKGQFEFGRVVAEETALTETFDHSPLRLVQYASGPMPVAQLRKAVALYGPIFMQIYGMTEAGSITCLYPHQHVLGGPEHLVRRLASAGVPPPSAAIRVVDDEGLDCATGVQGEVVAYTPSLLRGYWNNAVATVESLDRGWLKTGDVGWRDEDGYLFIVDRKKEVIISGGENIYPREVEEALHFHPEVEEVAVIGVPDDKWGEAVKAFAVTVPHRTVSEDDLIAFCKTRIASYKKPKSIEFVERLPRLANQKIDKKVLREPYWRGHTRRV